MPKQFVGVICVAALAAALAACGYGSDSAPEAEASAATATARSSETESASDPHVVGCDEIIRTVRSGVVGGYRVVLGVVAVPQAYRSQVVRIGTQPWPYWSKAGLVIRRESLPVSVVVPKAWRNRVAITWGNNIGIVSALRIASCPASEAKPWNAYAGGFYLRSRSACVPLIFRVGSSSAIVRFGLARKCA